MKAKFVPIASALALSMFLVPLVSAHDLGERGTERPEFKRPPLENLATELGFESVEDFKAAFDPESMNLKEFAASLGVELPERPDFKQGTQFRRRGHKMHEKFLEATGLTQEELKAELEAGKTLQEIAEAYGVELPERPEHPFHKGERSGLGVDPASLDQ